MRALYVLQPFVLYLSFVVRNQQFRTCCFVFSRVNRTSVDITETHKTFFDETIDTCVWWGRLCWARTLPKTVYRPQPCRLVVALPKGFYSTTWRPACGMRLPEACWEGAVPRVTQRRASNRRRWDARSPLIPKSTTVPTLRHRALSLLTLTLDNIWIMPVIPGASYLAFFQVSKASNGIQYGLPRFLCIFECQKRKL